MGAVIKVENLSKQYRLGEVGTGTLKDDFKRFRYRLMGKEDPFFQVGEVNDRTKKSDSDYVWALKDINFEIEQGDVVGIIGRNGAGKSTLLKILSRTTAPTTGSVKIKGRIASLLEVGTGFHGELSGRENIYLNGAIMGLRKWEIDKKLDEIIDFAGVEKYLDTPVKRYSSGMYVRLAFAVAAHLEPEILIVDEVLAVGDAEFQKKALGKMKNVSRNKGRTVLFVSHNLAAMKELCYNGIVMEHGKINSIGDIDDMVKSYLYQETKGANYIQQTEVSEKGSFHHISFYSESNINTNIFEASSKPYIIVEYSVKQEFSKFNVGMIISDALSANIYSTADTDLNPELLLPKKEGRYKVKVPLPLFNLNTGNYTVKLLMGIVNTELFDSVELTFSIENNNYINTGNRPGILLNISKWEYI
jgi:lipopolysaccharide transport system ATP-binding protein